MGIFVGYKVQLGMFKHTYKVVPLADFAKVNTKTGAGLGSVSIIETDSIVWQPGMKIIFPLKAEYDRQREDISAIRDAKAQGITPPTISKSKVAQHLQEVAEQTKPSGGAGSSTDRAAEEVPPIDENPPEVADDRPPQRQPSYILPPLPHIVEGEVLPPRVQDPHRTKNLVPSCRRLDPKSISPWTNG